MSYGDLYGNLIADFGYKTRRGILGFIVDVVPEKSVLNFQEKNKVNFHNHNRLRADGFLSRPFLLPHLYYQQESFAIRLGAMKFAGLDMLEGFPTAYYAARLSPLVLSEHYDKGIRLDYNYGERFTISAGLIDGDWEMGEADVFSLSDSRANSSPGGTVKATLKIGGVKISGSLTENRVGSNGGQKTYSNQQIIAAGYDSPHWETRAFWGELERGRTWGPGNQTNWPPEKTLTYGFELAARDMADSPLDLYAGWAKMWRDAGNAAGTIWLNNTTTFEQQWVVGIRWKEPFGLDILSFNLTFGDRRLDGDSAWRIVESKEHTIFFGVALDYEVLR
ncbi:MAG: hypothetical protein HZA78_03340 [Candidatus Schekmanbacteria bacterium]|nr:hypothetical protein [Candidatus Schekmanbacteria bacterium]